MKVKKGHVAFDATDLRVPLAEGDIVPCPKCAMRHLVKRDPRPGRSYDTTTGVLAAVRNEALYVDCPDEPGPIIVGMDGYALPHPLALTPRKGSP